MSDETRVRPFSTGSQYDDWQSSNCDRCTKGADEATGRYRCPIQAALDRASFDGGTVSPEMAARMGITPETRGRYVWPCAEVEWTEEWKAEWTARNRTN